MFADEQSPVFKAGPKSSYLQNAAMTVEIAPFPDQKLSLTQVKNNQIISFSENKVQESAELTARFSNFNKRQSEISSSQQAVSEAIYVSEEQKKQFYQSCNGDSQLDDKDMNLLTDGDQDFGNLVDLKSPLYLHGISEIMSSRDKSLVEDHQSSNKQ